MSACSSSGVSIITTSAQAAASAGGHHLKPGGLGLGGEAEPSRRATRDVFDAAVAQVHGVGVALAAVADDGHLLALDQIHVRIAVVINAHRLPLRFRSFCFCWKADAPAAPGPVRPGRVACLVDMAPSGPRADGDHAGARHVDQAERRIRFDEGVDLVVLSPVISNTKEVVVVVHRGAEDVGDAQRLDGACRRLPTTLTSASSRST